MATKKNRIGESAIMNNGQLATIVAYRGATDLDVQFEDGTIVYQKQYTSFKKREIANPNCIKPNTYAIAHIGETNTMTNGMTAKIIA